MVCCWVTHGLLVAYSQVMLWTPMPMPMTYLASSKFLPTAEWNLDIFPSSLRGERDLLTSRYLLVCISLNFAPHLINAIHDSFAILFLWSYDHNGKPQRNESLDNLRSISRKREVSERYMEFLDYVNNCKEE